MSAHTILRPCRRGVLVFCGVAALLAPDALAGIHTWDVKEVFSNADGTVQYVELLDVGVGGTEVGVGNGSITSNAKGFSWSNGPVTPPTNGKSYLIASQAFADLPGAPTPDVIIPAAQLPFFFDPAGDTVTFAGVDALVFGAIPTDGVDSFDEDNGVGTNTPKNYAGVQGEVNAAPPPPIWVGPILLPTALLLGAGGILQLRRRSANAA